MYGKRTQFFTGQYDVRDECEVTEKTNKMQQLDVYYQYFLNMFRASLCPSSGEQDVCYCMSCSPEDGHNDA